MAVTNYPGYGVWYLLRLSDQPSGAPYKAFSGPTAEADAYAYAAANPKNQFAEKARVYSLASVPD